MFVSRPSGYTLRRLGGRLAPEDERFDQDHPVAMKCEDCGRIGYGPRKHMREALLEHREKCPVRHRAKNTVPVHKTKIWVPGT